MKFMLVCFVMYASIVSLHASSYARTLDQKLLDAVLSEKCTATASLISKGANINYTGQDGVPVLIVALEHKNYCAARLLILHGANVNSREHDLPDDRTALIIATADRQLGLVQLLLKRSADVNGRTNDGVTALDEAPNVNIASILIRYGANVNARTEGFFTTPLYIAAAHRNIALARLLIAHGADLNKADMSGKTPLTVAIANRDNAMIHLLKAAKR